MLFSNPPTGFSSSFERKIVLTCIENPTPNTNAQLWKPDSARESISQGTRLKSWVTNKKIIDSCLGCLSFTGMVQIYLIWSGHLFLMHIRKQNAFTCYSKTSLCQLLKSHKLLWTNKKSKTIDSCLCCLSITGTVYSLTLYNQVLIFCSASPM